MPRKDYRGPLRGSIAHLVIELLQNADDGRMREAELIDATDQSRKALGHFLGTAVKYGWVRRDHDGDVSWWRLGENPVDLYADIAEEEAADAQVRELNASLSPSIFAYAIDRGAMPFACSLSTDGRLKIERHGRVLCELTNAERMTLLASAQKVEAPTT